jgi:hypothetical protein
MEHDTVNYNNESAAQKGVFGLHGGSRRIKASSRQEGIVLHWNPTRVENGARVEIVVDDATMTAEILGLIQ